MTLKATAVSEEYIKNRFRMVGAVEAGDKEGFSALLRQDPELHICKSVLGHFTVTRGGNLAAVRFMLSDEGLQSHPGYSDIVRDVFVRLAAVPGAQPAIVKDLYEHLQDKAAASEALRFVFRQVAAAETSIPSPEIAQFLIEQGGDCRKAVDDAKQPLLDRLKRISDFEGRLKM